MKIRDILVEAGDRERNVARQIAHEIQDNLNDLVEIIKSGSATGAGNPHYVQGLKDEIHALHEQLMELGFEYDPQQPDLIRPLTIT